MGEPGGHWVVPAIAAGFLIVGTAIAYTGIRREFPQEFKTAITFHPGKAKGLSAPLDCRMTTNGTREDIGRSLDQDHSACCGDSRRARGGPVHAQPPPLREPR
ncbi:hypothetical protein OHR68_13465 [Spirillospora sp. NBC_00431]